MGTLPIPLLSLSTMKHLPNILTLGNLFFGCMAIVFVFHAPPFVQEVEGNEIWVSAISQMYYGSICIFMAAACDFFDGFAARALNAHSPLGKDLDSLADVVSFGVAPAMIFAKLLWSAFMKSPHAMQVSIWSMSPAFLIACFGALRLARFNVSPSSTKYFTGVPIPAIGVFTAALPLITFYNTWNLRNVIINKWSLFLMIALLCFLMVSKLKMFTLKLSSLKFADNKAQYIWLILSLPAAFVFKFAVIPFSFFLYILLSLLFKPVEE